MYKIRESCLVIKELNIEAEEYDVHKSAQLGSVELVNMYYSARAVGTFIRTIILISDRRSDLLTSKNC